MLRIEDKGLERSTWELKQAVLSDLAWLSLDWDEGIYRQSERNFMYKQYAEKLVESSHVYRCFWSNEHSIYKFFLNPLQELEKMKEIAELKKLPPGKWATATDKEVQEELKLQALGDFVTIRRNGQPVYNFCVTIDDAPMAISHVIRAEKHLPNTPKQALICKLLDSQCFSLLMVSLILTPDRSKLSKRHGATSVGQAMVNYLALLSQGDGIENEFFTIEQFGIVDKTVYQGNSEIA
ncbi:glutamate--tRNA ligase, chloroplastic/mitochondrial-like [Durio zibethinus]|uniref:Glutamate--tRNA ligase, chloroplastic/mitochondrial-like n=1 Tax=Durio zibethinus TaxID=66656 RepID=A0A6P5Z8Q2_DURZI|nr:glutamate--tRNA ligase, chloroplastic/mitochondrial-like [Durio zibethinus]